MSDANGRGESGLRFGWWFGGLILATVLLTLGYTGGVIWGFGDWERQSQFGDMFGGLNAVFSGLALAGVVLAVFMQREELQLQRKELELTREELHRQADAQAGSQAALSDQVRVMQRTSEIMALGSLLQSLEAAASRTPREQLPRPLSIVNEYEETMRRLRELLAERPQAPDQAAEGRNLDRNSETGSPAQDC